MSKMKPKTLLLYLFVVLMVIGQVVLASPSDNAADRKPKPKPFKPVPRVRKEWRALTVDERQKVAAAFWTLKTTSTQDGRQLYGPNFNNHDEMLMLHACAVYDPRCDNGHFGPQFMTFHRAFLLKYERALLSVDPTIKALPYWNLAYDGYNGKYRNDPSKYIFTSNFFGDLWTSEAQGYAVTNGLFANWPVAEWTSEKFGANSWLAADNRCPREEWFHPKVCDSDNAGSTTYFRDHEDCTPYVARNPLDNSLNNQLKLGGSYEYVFTPLDFQKCISAANIKNWMDWQNCIEFSGPACNPHVLTALSKPSGQSFRKGISALEDEASGDVFKEASMEALGEAVENSARTPLPINITCNDSNLMGSFVQKGKLRFVNFFHSQAHLKNGLDLADVTTSPNDAGSFTGHHSNVDRSNMIWQRSVPKAMQRKYWMYPRSANDLAAKGRSKATISGPFSTYDLGVCGSDNVTFSEYRPLESAWISGTWLDEVVNSGFAFKNLFDCTRDEVDWTGKVIKCNGSEPGYTHREILYWTAPERTPYVYDNMKTG